MRPFLFLCFSFCLLLVTSCGNQEEILAYDGLRVGEKLSRFKEKYPEHECTKNEKFSCTSNKHVKVEVNSDEIIFEIQVFSVIEDLTFNQVQTNLSKKYGNPKFSSQEFTNSLWCLNSDCSKKIDLKFSQYSKKIKKSNSKNDTSTLYRVVSPCEIFGLPSDRCDEDFTYISVAYKDEKLASLWIDKNNTELKKF